MDAVARLPALTWAVAGSGFRETSNPRADDRS